MADEHQDATMFSTPIDNKSLPSHDPVLSPIVRPHETKKRSRFGIRGRQKLETSDQEQMTETAIGSDVVSDDSKLTEHQAAASEHGLSQSQSLGGNGTATDAPPTSDQEDLSAEVTDAVGAKHTITDHQVKGNDLNEANESTKKDVRKLNVLQRFKAFLWSSKSGKLDKDASHRDLEATRRARVVAMDHATNSNSHVNVEYRPESPQLVGDSTVEKDELHNDDQGAAQAPAETDCGVEDTVTDSESYQHGHASSESELLESVQSETVDSHEDNDSFDEANYEPEEKDSEEA